MRGFFQENYIGFEKKLDGVCWRNKKAKNLFNRIEIFGFPNSGESRYILENRFTELL
jgi:hypothetical protein